MSKFESFKSIAKEIGGKIATEVATSLVGAKCLLEYDVTPTPFATVGGLFSIHSATKASRSSSSSHLNHPDSKVSVWILDKKAILAQDTSTSSCDFQQQQQPSKAAARSSSRHLEQLTLMIKYDLHTLSRLKHPGILRLITPLEETRNQLVFITEAIECPLSSILQNNLEHQQQQHQQQPPFITTTNNNNNPPHPYQPPFLTKLEKKYGLLELLSTLQFIHSNGQLVHRSISPDTVFIARDGHWKVAAFGFSHPLPLTGLNNSSKSGPPSPDIFDYDYTSGSLLQDALRPSLGYTAPELVDRNKRGGGSGNSSQQNDQSCDVFSFALLVYYVITGQQLIPLSSEYSSVDEYGQCIASIGRMMHLDLTSGGGGGRREVAQPLVQLTELSAYNNNDDGDGNIGEMSQLLKAALSPSPANRPRFAQLADCSWFTNDDQLNALKFLQDMLQHDNGSKMSYFKATFPRYSPQWSDRVLLLLVLPSILLELKTTIAPSSSSSSSSTNNTSKSTGRSYAQDQQHREIQSVLLPIILNISQKQSNGEFEEHMLPCLKPLIEMAQGESMLVLLRNVPLLARVILNNYSGNNGNNTSRSGAVSLLSMLLKKSLQAEAGVDCHTEGLKQLLTLLSSISTMAASSSNNSNNNSSSSGVLLKELKKTVLPAVHALTLATTTASVRTTCFQALATMATTTINTPLIKEESEAVLATALQVTSIDKSSATVSSVFKTCQALVAAATRGSHHHQQQQQPSSSSWGLSFAAEKVLPALCPLLASPSLNAAQVGKGCDMIRGILSLIEEGRKEGQQQGGGGGGGGGGQQRMQKQQAPSPPQTHPVAAAAANQRFNNSNTAIARPSKGNNVIKPVGGSNNTNNSSGAHIAGPCPPPLLVQQQPISISMGGPSSAVPPQQSNVDVLSLDMMRSNTSTGGTTKNNNKPKASSSGGGGGGMMQLKSNTTTTTTSGGDPFQELMMMGGSAHDKKKNKKKEDDGFDSLI